MTNALEVMEHSRSHLCIRHDQTLLYNSRTQHSKQLLQQTTIIHLFSEEAFYTTIITQHFNLIYTNIYTNNYVHI